MRISRVVVNASPLICLYKSGLESIIPALFEDVAVPDAVISEITASGKTDFPSRKLLTEKWIKRTGSVDIDPRVASWGLGDGESAVLSYAVSHPEYWAVIDDREARRCALSLQCNITGTMGLVVLAKRRGVIGSVRESVDRLRNAGLWVSEQFVKEVCGIAGEE